MRLVELGDAHRRLAVRGEPADVAQHLAARRGRIEALLHLAIVLRQAVQEIVDGALLEPGGNQALDLHVFHLELQAHLAAEDDDLAHEVGARQVVARIRLGVALRLGVLDDLRERRLAVVDVEQIGQRAGENALDARDLVAGLAQVAQRLDHRQARADGRFV